MGASLGAAVGLPPVEPAAQIIRHSSDGIGQWAFTRGRPNRNPGEDVVNMRRTVGSRKSVCAFLVLALAVVLAACNGAGMVFESPTEPVELLPDLKGTEWVLASLRGKSPVEGTAITLAFFPDQYLEGDAGCDSYGADYVIRGSEFDIPVIHRTSFACDLPDSARQQEAAYFQALESIAAYRAMADRLEFDDATGETILAFARKLPPPVDPVLRDTEWILELLHGQDLLEGSHLTLNLAQEGFRGFAGCNSYGGKYEAADKGALVTSEASLTAMDCQSPALMEQEQVYVEAIVSSAAYRVIDDRLEIDNAAGETVLVFVRKEQAAMNPDDLLGTAWRLASLDGDSLIEGSTITLAFHNEYRVVGHAGCRDYIATYGASGDDIGFSFFAMIDAGCSMDEALIMQDSEYTTVLGWASSYRLQGGQLEMQTERGEALVFERIPEGANAELEGTEWTLTAIVEEAEVEGMDTPLPRPAQPLPGTQITAAFENGAASGSAGCNTYTATYSAAESAFTVETLAFTEMACLDPAGVMEQEQRYLELLRKVAAYRIDYNQLWLETGDGGALLFTVQGEGQSARDCSLANAFPPEEGELVWPTLHQIAPERPEPGDTVEVRGTGGFLYWNNECGEFRNESARDFQLLFDGQPAGSITCYAHTCLADLTIPTDAAPGIHTLSVEGGSSLEIEVSG
jgi:heat shock protein HslJ